ncbi:venom metalloproteinase antarease-like TfasMP_A [Dermacentor variabilis]|uniref:venom metalloproteinase antarease-like TfasMP_A n=1 Tax=Dermacentor variabilis TaxID=34621 RepID=UPI003F5CB97A
MARYVKDRPPAPVKGMTWRKAACGVKKVAIASDTGDFFRTSLSAAHEISHALGSPHDEEETSKGCPESDRHLMNPYRELREGTYSLCSLKAINTFLKTPQAICLFGEVNIKLFQCSTSLENNPQLRYQRMEECGKRMREEQVISRIEVR